MKHAAEFFHQLKHILSFKYDERRAGNVTVRRVGVLVILAQPGVDRFEQLRP